MSRPAPPPPASTSWLLRMIRGWRCRSGLNRRDASSLVHTLYNFGNKHAALAVCERLQQEQPQNFFAYLHGIDLAVRSGRNLSRARRSLDRGLASLKDARERELLASLHLYVSSFIGRF